LAEAVVKVPNAEPDQGVQAVIEEALKREELAYTCYVNLEDAMYDVQYKRIDDKEDAVLVIKQDGLLRKTL
jgi:hypothetical protein